LDLRKLDDAPVLIASGVPPVSRLAINRGEHSVEREDGCDLPYLSLEWSMHPRIDGVLVDATRARIVNRAWLGAQVQREAGAHGQRVSFSEAHVRVPPDLMDCEDEENCGESVQFGAQGSLLVLVKERMGGDCYQRSCLLFQPSTGMFASPLAPTSWKSAREAAAGPCLFRFDESQTAFLVVHWLCVPHEACRDVGGTALGWLVGREILGEPGLGNFR
jgi:hypothetical protein